MSYHGDNMKIWVLILMMIPLFAIGDMSNWWCEVSVSNGIYRIEHPMSWATLSEMQQLPDENPRTGLKRIWMNEQTYKVASMGNLDQASISNLVVKTNDRIIIQESTMRVLRALVKTINLRLPVGQKITAEELKQAIKDEL